MPLRPHFTFILCFIHMPVALLMHPSDACTLIRGNKHDLGYEITYCEMAVHRAVFY